MNNRRTININIPALARVEGEGALDLRIHNDRITSLKLRIYEPPRYFEKLLENRYYYDVPDIVARICGICPVAYQMSASHALESIFNLEVTPWIRAMRRLFYCGEWIQSHSLHIHMLAAPDYLGFNSIIEMSGPYLHEVQRGLKLQSLGNDLIAFFGARSVHPVGARVGGFSKAPSLTEARQLLHKVQAVKQDAIELIQWVDTFNLPDDSQDFISVALQHPNEYPFNEGRIISDTGLDIAIGKFEQHFRESHIEHSTALHCLLDGKPYLVGPLARINLNRGHLPVEIHQLMHQLNTQFPSSNMFHSIVARAIEIYHCLLEAESILETYSVTDQPCIEPEIKAGTGYGCTEAPRGLLWHKYSTDENGAIKEAMIVPPTSQNQARIEEDLQNALIRFGLDKPEQSLRLHAEKVIRNYDPCISCATHFLNINVQRDTQKHAIENSATDLTTPISRTVIAGIGTINPGDDLAWRAIDILQDDVWINQMKEQGLELVKLDHPDALLHPAYSSVDRIIIIDSLRPGHYTDSCYWIRLKGIDADPVKLSSHEVGVLDCISLMSTLKDVHAEIALLGIATLDEQQLISMLHSHLHHSSQEKY